MLETQCLENASERGGEVNGGMTKKKEPTGEPSLEMEVEWMTVKAKRGKGDEMKWLEEGE